MCFGGGGGGGTITMPDTRAYDRQFEMQKAAIDSQMQNASMAMQETLNQSLRDQTDIREQMRDFQVARAEDQAKLEEEAMRLSVLMGTPPPEPTAQAPLVGSRDRKMKTTKGKSALKIAQTVATSSGQGTGLNITTQE